MKIQFVGARSREVAPAGQTPFTVKPGEVVDVPAVVGRSLLDQPRWFQEVRKPKDQGDE